MSDANKTALSSFLDPYMRTNIQRYADADFVSLFNSLVKGLHSDTVRSTLQNSLASFQQGFLQISHTYPGLINGFLYMTIHQAVRQTTGTDGRSEKCFNKVVDKIRRCSDLGASLILQCSDAAVPINHAKERLSQAYRLQLAFLGAIIHSFDQGPLSTCNSLVRYSLL